MLSVPTFIVEEEDWSAVEPTPESATQESMKLGRFREGIASLWCNSTAAEFESILQVVMSGSKKWNELDQFPIWFVELVALTLQCQVSPVSSELARSNVWLVMSNPVSVQLVAISRSDESKLADVSNSIDHPPIETPVDKKLHDN